MTIESGSFEYWVLKASVFALILLISVSFLLSGTSLVTAQQNNQRSEYGKTEPYGLYLMGEVEGWPENFETPDWVKNAIFYQVFPDRFRNGNAKNDPKTGDLAYSNSEEIYSKKGKARILKLGWDEKGLLRFYGGVDPWGLNWYGGDLQGVIEKVDYLDNLGVNAIYFNPTFDSVKSHGYNVIDYKSVNRYFGAPPERKRIDESTYKVVPDYENSLEVFDNMREVLENHKIKVVLDAVLNHTGAKSPWFDVDNEWAKTLGAYESKKSPYSNWYIFSEWPRIYERFANSIDSLPRVNNVKGFREYVFGEENSIISFWDNYGVDGWRLDVPGGQPHSFWEKFNENYEKINSNGYIVGEEWGDASSWLQGDEWDSTMNYRFRRAVREFMKGGKPSKVDQALREIMTDYPPEALYTALNLFDSHDTARILWDLGYINQETREEAIEKFKLGVIFQMTYPGAPVVYYGDEIGMTGADDPFCRNPFPWPDTGRDFLEVSRGVGKRAEVLNFKPSWDLYKHYQKLIRIRREYPVLRTGTIMTEKVVDNKGVYAISRTLGIYGHREDVPSENVKHNIALLVFNNSENRKSLTIDVSNLFDKGTILTDVLNEENILVAPNGRAKVSVKGRWGKVLISDMVDLSEKAFISLSGLSVPKNLKVGKSFQIKVEAVNVGDVKGGKDLELFIDGEKVNEDSVELEGGASGTFSFTTRIEKAGDHEIRVGDYTRSVEVRGKEGTQIWTIVGSIGIIIAAVLVFLFYYRRGRS